MCLLHKVLLHKGRFAKAASDSFFRRALWRKSWASGKWLFSVLYFQIKHFMLYLLETIYRTQDTREATIYFFCRVFWRKAMETLKASFFSLISLNIITKDILDFLTATVVYFQFCNRKLCSEKCYVLSVNSTVLVQIALQKKQLIAIFVEHFDENTIWINFMFHNPKCQESCFHNLYLLDSAI